MNARLERKLRLLTVIAVASAIGSVAFVAARAGEGSRDLGRLPIRGRTDGIDVVGLDISASLAA